MISDLSGGCSIEGLCMQLVKDGAIQQRSFETLGGKPSGADCRVKV